MSAPQDLCLLALTFPVSLEDAVVGLLLADPDAPADVSLVRAEGLGEAVPLRGADEAVRGRSARMLAFMTIGREASWRLLARLRERVASAEISWWRTPLDGGGRLCDLPAPDPGADDHGETR